MLLLRSSVRKHLSSACSSIARKELRSLSAAADVVVPNNNQTERIYATHALTLPMYSNPEVWAKTEELREALIKDAPNTGLDPTTVMPSVKAVLEYRLGRFIIRDGTTKESDIPLSCEMNQVMRVLDGLKQPIRNILNENGIQGDLRLPLGDVSPRNSNSKLLKLYPIRSAELNALKAINSLVFEAFKDSKILLGRYRVPIPGTEKARSTLLPSRAPPYLCSTVINSGLSEDRRPGVPLKSFNYKAVYTSSVFKPWPPTESSPHGKPFMRRVDLGAPVIPGLYLRPINLGDLDSRELVYVEKIDFADC